MNDAPQSGLDVELSACVDREVPCARLIGAAGSGKTYEVMRRVAEDSSYGLLTSTTGVSAVNLGAITINSTLRYSDTLSLRDAYLSGRLARTLHEIGLRHRRLVIEEYSMLHADQLDLIYRGVVEANRYADMDSPLGILLVGDLAQLPPVKGAWSFEAASWDRFAANTERLTRVWRQDGGLFLDGLNLLRAGDGTRAADVLDRAGATWHSQVDTEFDGTTILPKNEMVNRYNSLALSKLKGQPITLQSRRWGAQRREWGQSPRTHEWGIPPTLRLKIGALVMILANASDFSVVNGDLAHVLDWDRESGVVTVDLVRTGKQTAISPILRGVEDSQKPDGWPADAPAIDGDEGSYWYPGLHYRRRARRYVTGQIEYYPLRAAYATTVHKSQSLTLDRVQVDIRDRFFSQSAMEYVALSRCRTLVGLRIVGSRERFAQHCTVDERTLLWL